MDGGSPIVRTLASRSELAVGAASRSMTDARTIEIDDLDRVTALPKLWSNL